MILSSRRARLRPFLGMAALIVAGLASLESAHADKIKHPVAVFSGLDKITGRIISFEVATDETVQFGTLQITERACYTRPATEAPQTTTFVEVDEVDAQNEYKRIFSGWMFAASPGLHGIEHPVYDIWLTDCKGGGETVATPESNPAPSAAAPPAATEPSAAPPPENASPTPKKPATKPRRVQPQTPPPPVDNFGEEPFQQNQGPVEVGPPPGFNAPRSRRPAQDPDALVPPGDIPNGRRSPAQPQFPGDGF